MQREEELYMDERIQKLNEMIKTHQKIVFFGGAGVSTASGIPDFRSADGDRKSVV